MFFCIQAKSQSDNNKDISLYFKENVAIVDAKVRTVDKDHYVKELTLIDFKKTMPLPETFDFAGLSFIDNGKGYDKVAGDGSYTSSDHFLHNERIQYSNVERSVMEQVLTDTAFSHKNELADYLHTASGKIKVSIDCDIYVCHCNSCSCRTCWMPIVGPAGTYLGTVTHCLKIKNCHFEITWE